MNLSRRVIRGALEPIKEPKLSFDGIESKVLGRNLLGQEAQAAAD
jgi:hypothetical protein